MSENTPLQISLDGTTIEGSDVTVQVSINSVRNMSSSDSLHLFIAATLDDVSYTGYNGQDHHEDVFLGWINDGLEGELLSLDNEEIAKTYTWTCLLTGQKMNMRHHGLKWSMILPTWPL